MMMMKIMMMVVVVNGHFAEDFPYIEGYGWSGLVSDWSGHIGLWSHFTNQR